MALRKEVFKVPDKGWVICRGEDLVRPAKAGDAADAALPKLGTREKSYVPTGVITLVPPLAKGETRWLGYVFPRGRAGVRPWPPATVFETYEREAAIALAERAETNHDSWGMIYRELGLQTEFARLPRTAKPYDELRKLVAGKKIHGVIFAEDLLSPPTPATT